MNLRFHLSLIGVIGLRHHEPAHALTLQLHHNLGDGFIGGQVKDDLSGDKIEVREMSVRLV